MATEGSQRKAARLRVRVSDEEGRVLSPGLARWLAAVAPAKARGAVNVSLVSDGVVRRLNRRYRGKDRATDVLSFPAEPLSPRSTQSRKLGNSQKAHSAGLRNMVPFLGDIVIARGVARRQARAVGHWERAEVRVLALHGLLHLLGYDHESDAGGMARV